MAGTKSRGDGEGSIYKRASDGRWAAQVSLGWSADGRERKTVYGKTRAEVAAKLDAIRTDLRVGKPVSKDNVTVRVLMEDFLNTKKSQIRQTTYRLYEQMIRVHILPALAGVKVSQLDARQIQSFLSNCKSAKLDGKGKPKELSAQTIGHIRAVLRAALNDAIDWEIVSKNVAEKAKPPKVEKREVPVLSPAQAVSLLEAFTSHRYGPLFTILLGLGIRLGEARGLRWSDVSFDKVGGGTVTISGQMQRLAVERVDTELDQDKGAARSTKANVLTNPKSASSRRTISLPTFVVDALQRQADLQREWQSLAGTGWRNDMGLVFTNLEGGVVDDARLRKHFEKVLIEAGFPKMRLHDLRHVCVSLLIAMNVNMRIIQEILGHSSITLTMNTYGHLSPGTSQIAATAMQEALTRPPTSTTS